MVEAFGGAEEVGVEVFGAGGVELFVFPEKTGLEFVEGGVFDGGFEPDHGGSGVAVCDFF